MRLFAALYPEVAALDGLETALASLTSAGPPGRAEPGNGRPLLRWTPREQWHVTLAFYGDVPAGAEPDLAGALGEVAADAPAMRLELRGAGVFDHRVLWVGVGGQTEALRDLSAAAAAAAEHVGLRLDRTPRQRAHVTVARVRANGRPAGRRNRRNDDGAAALRAALEAPAAALAVYAGRPWWADELCLVESDRSDPSGRPRHDVVRRFALAGAARPATGLGADR